MECLKKSILIVEDNPDMRQLLVEFLEDLFHVTVAADGSEALRLLRGSMPPQVVLLDLMLPVLSGWDVLAELRSHPYLARTPVIVISALAQPPSGINAEAYLQKPFQPETLVRLVTSLVRDAPGRAKDESRVAR
jgi:CheY-like chemotaxis protein